jgi:hypothetical protein
VPRAKRRIRSRSRAAGRERSRTRRASPPPTSPAPTGGADGRHRRPLSVDKSYHSAEVKFRGWNTNFKRNWLQQIHVERGAEQDIETAVVKEMIKIIRKEKQGDFVGIAAPGPGRDAERAQEDERELQAFLMKEMFPEYTRGSR